MIDPPDSVLMEAGRMKPRPSIASALQVAKPTARMAWWAEQRMLTEGLLSRLHWMLSVSTGEAWIVVDGEVAAVSGAGARAAVEESRLAFLEEIRLTSGECAIRVGPTGTV